ncbi:hypothetical protein CK203_012539 [Vitis vinifera]|uniref:Uncharacterized protein n=1 Tax=Vitis vinifera TaxID=29760 RepID=A0A438KMS4_VITVI|nr:hypothetical protein CK203_012539 [Vitis vinifera]
MEAKSFEISIEEVSGKLRGVIVEGEEVAPVGLSLEMAKLERCANGVGRFILCLVYDVEAKRFIVIFLEGRGLLRGWSILASKLGSLGARELHLTLCVVGKCGDRSNLEPWLPELRRWVDGSWVTKRIWPRSLQGDLRGLKILLDLVRWNPKVGCSRKGGLVREEWVRVTGLPLHLWCWVLFKKLGDSCGGFIAMDKNTTFLCNKHSGGKSHYGCHKWSKARAVLDKRLGMKMVGWHVMVFVGGLNFSVIKGSINACNSGLAKLGSHGVMGLDGGLVEVGYGALEDSEAGKLSTLISLANKALLNEASRFLGTSSDFVFPLGSRASSSPSPFGGGVLAKPLERRARASRSTVGKMDLLFDQPRWNPLRVVLADGKDVENGWVESKQ